MGRPPRRRAALRGARSAVAWSPVESPPDGLSALRASTIWLSAGVLITLGVLTYANSLSGPFLFDDQSSIVENRYIRQLWPPWRLMHAPANAITTARPLVSLSLAINYALGGLDVRGFHAVNIAI